jgi:hypothetical protein
VIDDLEHPRCVATLRTGRLVRERTVASHLTHIYAQVGVRSRTELVCKVQTL